ncbi:MAG: hypothetical protein Tsb0014_15140 [Pleurocapsa sp.]
MITIESQKTDIKYLDVRPNSEIDNLIQSYCDRLNEIYHNCHNIQVKIANTSRYDAEIKTQSSYWVSINLKLSETSEIKVVRKPKSLYDVESVNFAVTEGFAMLYRKLIEDKLNYINYAPCN